MVYIICYDWPSTSGNHTGMRYLYEYIQKRNPELYKMYTFNMGRRFLDNIYIEIRIKYCLQK